MIPRAVAFFCLVLVLGCLVVLFAVACNIATAKYLSVKRFSYKLLQFDSVTSFSLLFCFTYFLDLDFSKLDLFLFRLIIAV